MENDMIDNESLGKTLSFFTNIILDFDEELLGNAPNSASNQELEDLRTQIHNFMKEKPSIESKLVKDQKELEDLTHKLNDLKLKIADNRKSVENSKEQLEAELNKKQHLETQVIEIEKILDLMRKELYSRVINGSNQVTYVEPEEYKTFKREGSKKIMMMLDEKTLKITRQFKSKNRDEYEVLTHIEEKADEIF